MFPKPDRSNHDPRRAPTADDRSFDLGWDEGFFSDGRPYRAEAWVEEGTTCLTFFFSSRGLEDWSKSQFAGLLEREGLAAYLDGDPKVSAKSFADASGNDMWSVTLIVGIDRETYVDDKVRLRAYRSARDELRIEWAMQLDRHNGFRSADEMVEEIGVRDYVVRNERQAYLTMGPPASGKSTLSSPLVRETGSFLIDADEVKSLMPEYEGGKGDGLVHEESCWLIERLVGLQLDRGANILFPMVGRTLRTEAGSGLADIIETLVHEGYDVHLVITELPALEAAKRAMSRFEKTGRFVDPEYIIREVGNRPQVNFDRLVQEHSDIIKSFRQYDNDVQKGTSPKLLLSLGEQTPSPGNLIPFTPKSAVTRKPLSYHEWTDVLYSGEYTTLTEEEAEDLGDVAGHALARALKRAHDSKRYPV